MRKHLLAAGIAALALLPTMALAQSCEDQRHHQSNGTTTGAVIGGVAGAAVAGGHDRLAGALIGGTLGAVVGNQATKPDADCRHAYGFYDDRGMWHANAVDRADARGYYDRNGAWVEGAPNGYYDRNGNWIAGNSDVADAGYYDRDGRWVPASADGYYDVNGQWIGGVASGYYDGSGRWIAGPVSGHYDAEGHWISGAAAGHYDDNHVWIADAEPGYYDADGHWRAGQVMGYYDARGRWIETAPSAGAASADVSYNTGDWTNPPGDVRARADWLDQRIRRDASDGRLTQFEANTALNKLGGIRREEDRLSRRHNGLTANDENYIQGRLDSLSSDVRAMRHDNRH